jgi:hypothetical protein
MPITSKYIFVAAMDVDVDHEALFNEVYDSEHVPFLMEVPGVLSVTRLKGEAFALSIGGEEMPKPAANPVYSAIYEIESPDVLKSDAWAEAIERGRWSAEVRPHTHNKVHTMFRVL